MSAEYIFFVCKWRPSPVFRIKVGARRIKMRSLARIPWLISLQHKDDEANMEKKKVRYIDSLPIQSHGAKSQRLGRQLRSGTVHLDLPEIPLCNLRSSMCDFTLWYWIVQRTSAIFGQLFNSSETFVIPSHVTVLNHKCGSKNSHNFLTDTARREGCGTSQ